jgi:hypothetical protein
MSTAGFRNRASILFSALLALGAGVAAPTPVLAVNADTVAVIDRGFADNFNPENQVFRAPDYQLNFLAHTVPPSQYGQVEVDVFGGNASFQGGQFFAATGEGIVIGQTYTHVKSYWNPAGTPDEARNTLCDDATTIVRELELDVDGNVTKMAWDLKCGGPQGGGFAFRKNSTLGYALMSDNGSAYFGPPILPGQTADATYTITSTGTTPLHVTNIALESSPASGITILNDACTGSTVAPGSTCDVDLRAAPVVAQNIGDYIDVTSDSVSGSWARGLTAWVDDPLGLSTGTLDLGASPATVTSAAKSVTLSNNGVIPVSITGIDIQGNDPADFEVTSEDCTAGAVPAGGSCTVSLAAAPHLIGPVSAVLELTGDTVVGQRNVNLTASGTDPVQIAPTQLDLPTVRPGNSSAGVVTVSSIATVDLPVTSVDWFNSYPEWSITDNGCAEGIPAGGSCDVHVRLDTHATANPYQPFFYASTLQVKGPGILGTRSSSIDGLAQLPGSGVGWALRGPVLTPRWNFGNALARAVYGSTTSLIQVASSNKVGSSYVSDTGTKMPVYSTRSTDTGAHWGTATRINPTTQHGIWPAVAASGRYVSVAWVSASKVVHWSNTAPRILYVRTSTNSGNGSWGTIHRITSTTGRVDHPDIAVSGALVVVGYTDSATGSVRVAISKDHGATWRIVALGTTTVAASWGKTGLVSVAASGTTIAVSWISATTGAVKARVSTNSGTTWAATASVAVGSVDGPSVAIAGSRVGVGWSNGVEAQVRTLSAGVWSAEHVVPAPLNHGYGPAYQYAYSPTLTLSGTTGIGIAWTDCFSTCDVFDATTLTDLLWSESSTNGSTWSEPQIISTGASGYGFRDDSSIIQPSSTQRLVLVNVWGVGSKLGFYLGASSGPVPMVSEGASRPGISTSSSLSIGGPRAVAGLEGPWGATPLGGR